MASDPAHTDGDAAEQRALEHLSACGLRLIERNYRSRWGEIDLVMDDGATIVFVEVRYRRHRHFGGALGSIDERKRRRIVHTAQDFLARRRLGDRTARFDVVSVAASDRVDWVAGAFEAD